MLLARVTRTIEQPVAVLLLAWELLCLLTSAGGVRIYSSLGAGTAWFGPYTLAAVLCVVIPLASLRTIADLGMFYGRRWGYLARAGLAVITASHLFLLVKLFPTSVDLEGLSQFQLSKSLVEGIVGIYCLVRAFGPSSIRVDHGSAVPMTRQFALGAAICWILVFGGAAGYAYAADWDVQHTDWFDVP